jgi:hypothetical protein
LEKLKGIATCKTQAYMGDNIKMDLNDIGYEDVDWINPV